jgi:glycosyltransferase involved in cell wall biosynthesis
MKIGTLPHITIDALPLFFEGGISNYTRPLLDNLIEQAGADWRIRLLFRTGFSKTRVKQYYRYRRVSNPENRTDHLLFLPDRVLAILWKHGIFVPVPRGQRQNIFLATTELVPRFDKAKVGWIMYDLIQLRIPKYFGISKERFLSSTVSRAKRADFIIAISECTKRDVQEFIQYPEEKICVIYPGVSPPQETPKANYDLNFPQRPYIYYLGALALNKNVDGMLRVFSNCIHKYGLDVEIVLTGKDFCGGSFWQRMIKDLRIEGRVHITGWISENEKEHLLANATMLWQFSWYEGFGLPVLEAASRGIPVLYTNRGAVPEILTNPEQEIDPSNEEDAASKAAQALRSPEMLETWKRLGLARASKFSWKRSAQKLLDWMEERF